MNIHIASIENARNFCQHAGPGIIQRADGEFRVVIPRPIVNVQHNIFSFQPVQKLEMERDLFQRRVENITGGHRITVLQNGGFIPGLERGQFFSDRDAPILLSVRGRELRRSGV